MIDFVWTQSAVKDLEKDQTCPSRWKGQWLDRAFKSTTSEAANYGNYFEYLVIGANAKGEVISDLPRTLKGDKTTTQRRIEAQAAIAKEMLFDKLAKSYLGYSPVDTQVKLSGAIAGIQAEGTLDIEATQDADGYPTIIDLKCTEDIGSTRTVYGWGNPTEEMDLLQQVLYQQLYFQQHGVLPKMVLMVFEHGLQQRIKIINIKIGDRKIEEMMERFMACKETVELYTKKGFTFYPSEKECKNCPLTCDKRFKQQQIIFENVNYY
jgi:hypothetical protein